MSDVTEREERKRFMKSAAPLVIALVLGVLYIVSIHPWSGMLGGAFFILVGSWAVPSAINLLLSYFVVSFIRVRRLWKAVVFVAVSFVLGMNTLLVPLFMRAPDQPSTFDIYRPLHVNPVTRVDQGLMHERAPGEIAGVRSQSALGVQVSASEGCMCMWFTPPVGENIDWQVWHVINGYLQRRDSIEAATYARPELKDLAIGGVHFDLRYTRGKRPYTVNLLVTVYDGLEPTAKFTQFGIPVWTTDPETGHPDRISLYQFLPNTESMLLRQNFWVFFLDKYMTGFSKDPLKAFLKRAIVRG